MREGLLEASQGAPRIYGVKSFEHAFDRLEERCHAVLDLVPWFDERYIRDERDWEGVLHPNLRTFLQTAAADQPRLRLALDAHVTLALAVGAILNIKSGRHVELDQRSVGRAVWSADDFPSDPDWPALQAELIEVRPDESDLAVAVSLTHDVSADVHRYCASSLSAVGWLLILKLSAGAGSRSVACGRHAFELADAVTSAMRAVRYDGADRTHLFIAAPNAFTFFLGQRQTALGPNPAL
jgi:hypothetical protein